MFGEAGWPEESSETCPENLSLVSISWGQLATVGMFLQQHILCDLLNPQKNAGVAGPAAVLLKQIDKGAQEK